MRVRLTRKLAPLIDGVDLSSHDVGDVFDLPEEQAKLVIAEDWAILERRTGETSSAGERRRREDQLHHPPHAGLLRAS